MKGVGELLFIIAQLLDRHTANVDLARHQTGQISLRGEVMIDDGQLVQRMNVYARGRSPR